MESEDTAQRTPLMEAAATGALETLQKLLATSEVDVNARDEKGDTALHAACAHGHVAVARALVEAGARVDVENEEGNLVLHVAALSGHVEVIEYLVKEVGVEVDARNKILRTPLHQAAREGMMDAVKELLKNGAELEARDEDAGTVLFRAALNARREVVEYLLDQGANRDAVETDGWQPIHGAAQSNDIPTIELLLERGADLHSLTEKDGRSVLDVAAAAGAVDAVKYFVSKGLEVDATNNDGQTALYLAANNGYREVVEYLLDAGAGLKKAIETDGWLPLHGAAQSGDIETIEFLLERGADLHSLTEDGSNVLHIAAEEGELDAVKLFVERGLDVNAANNDGDTALSLADENGHSEVVEYLKDEGADVDDDSSDGSTDAMPPICAAAESGDVEAIKDLLESGADLHTMADDGRTLLHMSAGEGHVEAVDFFVQSGLDVDGADNDGQTPLFTAAISGHRDVVEYLLDKGADVNVVESDGWQPLHAAAQSDDVPTIELLLERGADLHSLTEDGRSVLHVAAEQGAADAVKFFLLKGLEVDATNNDDQTALFLAALNGHCGVVEFLLDQGADRDAVETDGWLPLHAAADSGDIETLKLLVQRGADMHTVTEDGKSGLHIAAEEGNVESVKFFVEGGLDVDATDNDDQAALLLAALDGHCDVVEYLLDAGADLGSVDANMNEVLQAALESRDAEVIDLLAQRGANLQCAAEEASKLLRLAVQRNAIGVAKAMMRNGVDTEAADFTGRTALHYATSSHFQDLVECLLEGGADIHAVDKKGQTALHLATERCDIEMITTHLKHGADMHCKNKHGYNMLHLAAFHGRLDVVKFFVQQGVATDEADAFGETPLHVAVEHGGPTIVEYLLAQGVNVNASSNIGQLPIHVAARVGEVSIIEHLLRHGADLLTPGEEGRSVLHEAAAAGNLEAAEIFLRKGVAVDATDDDQQTALFVAAKEGHDEVVERLLDAGAAVDVMTADGWQPIHGAAFSGDERTLELLIERGADLHALTQDGHSVIFCAVLGGSEEMISSLRSRGFDIDAKEFSEADEDGWLAVHRAARDGDLDTIKALAKIGVDIHAVTESGESTLYVAADNGQNEVIEYLIEDGADVNQVDEDGWTALHAAARNRHTDTMELLIKLGADVNAKDNDGESILHVAAFNCKDNSGRLILPGWHTVVVDVLLREGADVKAIDESNGWTTFLYAAAGGSVELLRLLIADGADPHAVAQDGKTALHIACWYGQAEAAEYLLDIGVNSSAVDEVGYTALHCAAEEEGSGCVSLLLRSSSKALISMPDQDGNQPLHLVAQSHLSEETKQLLDAGADVNALTNAGESPLQLAVFAAKSDSAPSTISRLCAFGAEWTTKCEEKLDAMKAELEASDASTADEKHQLMMWCTGLRTCVLHWEKHHLEGSSELIEVPVEVIERGAASVKTYLADAISSNADELTYRCKVCVVGPSEWGKSSLVKSIETMKPFLMDIQDRTIGIELVASSLQDTEPWEGNQGTNDKITGQDAESVDLVPVDKLSRRHEITFWDFAGQDVYRVAHSLFFSRRTLYVLVVDVKAYLDQLKAVASLRPAALEAAMDRFLSRHVFRWVRTIFARQPDAEFLVLGTKADLLEDEEETSAQVWNDLQSRVYQWKMNYMRDLEKEYGVAYKASSQVGQTVRADSRVRVLSQKLTRLASSKWLVVSVTRRDSIEAVRQALRQTIEASERGFPMWNTYSRVLQALSTKRDAANRPGDGQHRIEYGMMMFRPLCRQLMDEVDGLEYDECREILRTLHDLGDIIWYEHDEAGELREFIILDPKLVIDIVREVISHEHTKKSGVVAVTKQDKTEEQPRIDGRVSHELLETFPLWKHMDKELVYAFKMLLKQFQLVYPADDEVMDPESDLIVPCYWKAQMETGSASTDSPGPSVEVMTRRNHHCWEYEISADLADAIFEQFAVQSYTSFMKREVRANCIESSCKEFQSWITLHPGKTKHDVIRVEVASEDPDISWLNMRYYLMKLEKVLDGYSGLGVPRYIVVGDKRHSIAPAAKALRDTIMMGRDVKALRVEMPWLPPDLDWFISRAWRDLSSFRELQMMHLVRDKLEVLQKLVVKGDSQRRYPALWSLEYKAEKRVAVLRMLSDLSGRCYHVPIEIEVPPAFLAKHGGRIKAGVSILSNIMPSSLSVPILQIAIDGAVSCLEAETGQAAKVHNLIERFDLTTGSGDVIKSSTDSGLSPGGTMALLRALLKLHNDSLDELSITEICNLECAATSKGEYVWAHIHEINMLKNELTPCQPRYDSSSNSSDSFASEPVQEPATPELPPRNLKSSASKLRLSLCIETVAGLPDWDWYKTYCKWQLFYGGQKTLLASGATTHNADNTTQPSWPSLEMPLDPVDTVEMLKECRLAIQVKRQSRIGWTKLIGEGEVNMLEFVKDNSKLGFSCDQIEVSLQTTSSVLTQRVVKCQITASS